MTFALGNGQGSFLLGDDFMLNKDIVFGESVITIYQQSSCSGQVVSYQYSSNQPQLSSSASAPPEGIEKEGTTIKVFIALGMTIILAICKYGSI